MLHCNLLLNRWPLSFGGGGPMIHLMFLNSSKSVIRFIMFGLVCFCHSPLQFSVITFHFISLSLSLHRLKKTPCVYVCGYMHACSSVCSWIAATWFSQTKSNASCKHFTSLIQLMLLWKSTKVTIFNLVISESMSLSIEI